MRPALSIGPDEPIRAAAAMMTKAGIPAISVVAAGQVVGLISARDLVENAVARSLSADATMVFEIMNASPVRISDDRDVDSAMLVMQARDVHELLVQDFTGRIVGVFCDCGCSETHAETAALLEGYSK